MTRLLLEAGRAAFILRHKLPLPPLARGLERMTAWCEQQALHSARHLPPNASPPGAAKLAVHTLLCRRDVEMYLWAIHSLARVATLAFQAVVHDDGSLDDDDIAVLERQVPGIRIHRRPAADALVNARLAQFPACRAFRDRSVWGLKLLDFNLLTEGAHVLSMDADVLFFREPAELAASVERGEQKVFYMDDGHRYSARTELLSHFGKVVDGFNAGFILYPHDFFPLAEMEAITAWMLAHPDAVDRIDDQLVYSVMSAARSHATFPEAYTAHPSRHPARERLVAKHYNSCLKLFFSLEGLRHIPRSGRSVRPPPRTALARRAASTDNTAPT